MILTHTSETRKQFLHLSAHHCEKCKGPVVTAWLAVRETEIERETQIRTIGVVCLSCGNKQEHMTQPNTTSQFPPVKWE
jgi:RNase P subunit RPR2